MNGIALCEEKIYTTLRDKLKDQGVELKLVNSPLEIPDFEGEVLIVQFPFGKIKRGELFQELEKLWETRYPFTVIIKGKSIRIRERDLRENVMIFNGSIPPEEINKNIAERINSSEFLLNKGLEAYVEKRYRKAYEYWMRLARKGSVKEPKVFEYLNIAKREFKEAGIETSELEQLLESRVDPYEAGIKEFSKGNLRGVIYYLEKVNEKHPKFIQAMALLEKAREEIELEEAEEVLEEIELKGREKKFNGIYEKIENISVKELSPQEAFLLSLMNGKTPLGEIASIMPMSDDDFLKAVKNLMEQGYIKRKE